LGYAISLRPGDRIRADDFLRAARCLASECAEWTTGRILAKSSERLRGVLSKEAEKTTAFRPVAGNPALSDADVFDLSVASGLLSTDIRSGLTAFQDDPVAEYLAASYRVLNGLEIEWP
jgi:hypothetical protein